MVKETEGVLKQILKRMPRGRGDDVGEFGRKSFLFTQKNVCVCVWVCVCSQYCIADCVRRLTRVSSGRRSVGRFYTRLKDFLFFIIQRGRKQRLMPKLIGRGTCPTSNLIRISTRARLPLLRFRIGKPTSSQWLTFLSARQHSSATHPISPDTLIIDGQQEKYVRKKGVGYLPSTSQLYNISFRLYTNTVDIENGRHPIVLKTKIPFPLPRLPRPHQTIISISRRL